MKKRFNIMLLVLIICLSIFSSTVLATSMSFTDVKTSDWFYEDVKTAVEMGLVNGKSETIYAPDDNLTYGEAAKLAACMHQRYSTGSVSLKNGEPWYQSFVDYCKLNKIILEDYPWLENATRAGYMEIFSRALPDTALSAINTVADNSIPDVPSTHKNAGAIYKLYRAGILQGVDAAHNCKPESNIKRSEVAAILTRMMNADKRITFTMGKVKKDDSKELKITKQPVSQTVKYLEYATFTVEAQGTEPFSYQWQVKVDPAKGWEDLEEITIAGRKAPVVGAKTAELNYFSIKNEDLVQGIRCIVRDANKNEIISNEVNYILKVEAIPLTIIQQPQDVKGKLKELVELKVEVSGGVTPLKYQWQFIEVGTSTFYNSTSGGNTTNTLRPPVEEIIYDYRCIITDANNNSVTSDLARVEKIDDTPPLVITKQPQSTKGKLKELVELRVEVSGGAAPLRYQWQYVEAGTSTFYNSTSGGNTTNTLRPPVEEIIYDYRCIITDANNNSVTSDIARVEKEITIFPLSITKHPPEYVVNTYSYGCKIEASGGSWSYSYQWMEWKFAGNGTYAWFPLAESSAFKGTKTNFLQMMPGRGVYNLLCEVTDNNTGISIGTNSIKIFSNPESYAEGGHPPVIMNSGTKKTSNSKREFWVEAAGLDRHNLYHQWQWSDDGVNWYNVADGPLPYPYNSFIVEGSTNSYAMGLTYTGYTGLVLSPEFRCVVTSLVDGRQVISKSKVF